MIAVLTVSTGVTAEVVHHELHVKLQPDQSRMTVVDYVQLPATPAMAEFTLRSDFTVDAPGVELVLQGKSADGRLHHYQIDRLPGDGKVQLRYQGRIATAGIQGPFAMPDSVLDTEAAYLDGGSHWVPRFKNAPWHTFRMKVEVPQGWQIISQGKRSVQDHVYVFDMPHVQNQVYLVGGPYQRYSMLHNGIGLEVYLYQADSELAENYLRTSAEYVDLYSEWIGPYPYSRFAVVENRWQTGYGMPSFTLLGSRVIRLPFILHTSLPHEILHNWWGNGIYIDYSRGNWSEGLTAYMSDHYRNEQQGKGAEYRRKALEKYANFAAEGRDFALAAFSSRHDEASQAVGYSKSLMLFHMLRSLVGDDVFDEGIRRLWQQYRFRTADFTDVIRQLYPVAAEEKNAFIEQWLYRVGAPDISLGKTVVSKLENEYQLSVEVDQLQKEPGYKLQIPIDVLLEGNQQPVREQLILKDKHAIHTFRYQRRPREITLDPDYDVFRQLHPQERPASLGRLFGAMRQILVIPQKANEDQVKAWRELAAAWSGLYGNVQVVKVDDLNVLPQDSAVWLLGWENELLEKYQHRFASASQQVSSQAATLDGQRLVPGEHAVVLLDPDNRRSPLGFIGADDPQTIAWLARKMPHYSSYGALAFDRHEAKNLIKQHLPVFDSPMVKKLAP